MDAPKIPTLKDSQKPQVKVRGLEAGVTLFDRLKQFKKKDLAFILAGLGTLFMAPLAEHFMMAPEQASDMTAGMGGGGKGGDRGIFNPNGGGPYEPGNTGLAAGNPAGGSLSDIITPLNVRDPSALVMGPGATQQPPTQSAAPATPPPTAPVARNDSDLKDALAASGARAVGAASKAAKALLPVPKVALAGAGGLRGLGVASGGSSASGGAGISAANVSSKANTGGGGLNLVKSTPGYRGAASGRGQGQGGSGMEALKAAADKQGNVMNQGSASTALDQAAAQQIPGGGAGIGGGGQGGTSATDKGAGGNQDKSSKNVGESLEFLKQKAIQEKKIELWGKEQEAKDMSLLMAQTRNEAIKGIVGAMAKSLGDCAGKMVVGNACVDPSATPKLVKCGNNTFYPNQFIGSCDPKIPGKFTFAAGTVRSCDNSNEVYQGCRQVGSADGDAAKDKKDPSSVTQTGGVSQQLSDPAVSNLTTACQFLDDVSHSMDAALGYPEHKDTATKVKAYVTAIKKRASDTVALRDALQPPSAGGGGECAATKIAVAGPILPQQQNVLQSVTSDALAGTAPGGLLPALASALTVKAEKPADGADDMSKLADAKAINENIRKSAADVAKIDGLDPEKDAVPSKPDDGAIKKLYKAVNVLSDESATAKIAGLGGAVDQVSTAAGKVNKAAATARDIQKHLDAAAPRYDAASGPGGTVAKIVPLDNKAAGVLSDEVFKRDSFDVGQDKLIAPTKLAAGGGTPGKDIASGVQTAQTKLDKAVTSDPASSFTKYKETAKEKKDETMFPKTNTLLADGVQSLIQVRTTQLGELNDLYSTATTDLSRVSSAANQTSTAK